ncbi:MAG: TolC family outer membrane protein, partial [Pseudomonadota bacterium]
MKTMRLLTIGVALAASATAVQAEDLLDIYQRALQSDPQIREAEATRLAAGELKPQARALLFPQISATASESRSDSEGIQTFFQETEDDIVEIGLASTENRDIEGTNWDITLSQTVFRWDQYVGLAQADKRVAQAEADYESAQQSLLLRVSERYFDVLAARDALEASEANREAIAKQLDQSQKRFEVGLIAITDVQESQAAFDQAVADEILAKRTLANAANLLSEVTGSSIGTLAKPAEEFPLVAPAPENEDLWVSTALEQNLDLVASRIATEIASKEVSVRRSGHLPTLDLVVRRTSSDTTLEQSTEGSPFVPLQNSNDQDSISLQLNVPIFTGGTTSSRVKQAVHEHRAARERAQRIARETERLTRDSYL